MCPARGILRVVGYEVMPGEDLPRPVTRPQQVSAEPAAA
jgi:hypothetical protein